MLATKQTKQVQTTQAPSPRPVKRIWKTPTTRVAWLWLGIALVLTTMLGAIFFYTIKTQQYPSPYTDPLRLFGIVSFVFVLMTIAYTLRRRFVRQLQGRVQSWLWVHTWFGIAAIIIALVQPFFDGLWDAHTVAVRLMRDNTSLPHIQKASNDAAEYDKEQAVERTHSGCALYEY